MRLWRRLALYAPFYAANSSYVYGTLGNLVDKDILRGRTLRKIQTDLIDILRYGIRKRARKSERSLGTNLRVN